VQNAHAFSYDTKDDCFRSAVRSSHHIPMQTNLSFNVALRRTEEVAGCCQDSNLLTVNYPLCAYRWQYKHQKLLFCLRLSILSVMFFQCGISVAAMQDVSLAIPVNYVH